MILASASPRRRELLGLLGVPFSVEPAALDESLNDGEAAADYVQRIAREKALAVAARNPSSRVLAADTAVVVDGQPLGKPVDADDARAMLRRLSGRSHEVMTAVVLSRPGRPLSSRLSLTRVHFAIMPETWICAYVASGDPMDKAGAYGIQNEAGVWIHRIDGSYTGVVGLPLFETGELLREAGLTTA